MLNITKDKIFDEDSIITALASYANAEWLRNNDVAFLNTSKYDENVIIDIIRKCSKYDGELWDKKYSLAESIHDADYLNIVKYRSSSGNENYTITFDSVDHNNNKVHMSIFSNDTMMRLNNSQYISNDDIISEFKISSNNSVLWTLLMFCIYYINKYCNNEVNAYTELRDFLGIK